MRLSRRRRGGGNRHGDHEVEDDVFGEEVEEVVAVHVFAQTVLDDAEERIQGSEVFDVVYHWTGSVGV